MRTQTLLQRLVSAFKREEPRQARQEDREGAPREPHRGATMHTGSSIAPRDTHDRTARETERRPALISPQEFAAIAQGAKAAREAETKARADAAIERFVDRAARAIEAVVATRVRFLEDPSHLPEGIRLSVESFSRHEECHYAMASYLLPKAHARLEERLRRTLGPSASFRFMATREWYATTDDSGPAYTLTISLVSAKRIDATTAHAEYERRVADAAGVLADSVMKRLDAELRRAAARGDDATAPLPMFTLVPATANVMVDWVRLDDSVPVMAKTLHGRRVERLSVPWSDAVQRSLDEALRARLSETPYELRSVATSTLSGSGDVRIALAPRP